MSHTVQHLWTRPRWMRPPVLSIGAVAVFLLIFLGFEISARWPAASYAGLLDVPATAQAVRDLLRMQPVSPIDNATNSGASSEAPASRPMSDILRFGDPLSISAFHQQQVATGVSGSAPWISGLTRSVPPLLTAIEAFLAFKPTLLAMGMIVVAGVINFRGRTGVRCT